MLIGISGKIGAGKDTFAVIIVDIGKKLKIPFEKKSFAHKLKLTASIFSGRDLEEMFTHEGKNIFLPKLDMSVGTLQQKLGDGARETIHPEIWIIALFADYTDDQNWVISDLRYKNEAQAVLDLGGILVRIEGDPAEVRANSTRDMSHISEVDLDYWEKWNYKFTNHSGMLESKLLDERAMETIRLAKYATLER